MTNRTQLFASPLGDGVAKYILSSDERFRNYILSALSGYTIKSSEQLDDHLNPFDSNKDLRALINSNEFEKECNTFSELSNLSDLFPALITLTSFYREKLKNSFPIPLKNSTLDFKCQTNFGYITIEFQLIDHKNWDSRALAYVAHVYGNQVKRGDLWTHDLDPVFGINLLGYEKGPFWKTDEFIRHYIMKDKISSTYIMHHLQLIQYSIGDINFESEYFTKLNKPLRDVMKFFRLANQLTELPEGIDVELKAGYEMINDSGLKEREPEIYDKQHKFWNSLSRHDETLKNEGREEGLAEGMEKGEKKAKIEMAKAMLEYGMPIDLLPNQIIFS